jgi:hypothetical protein
MGPARLLYLMAFGFLVWYHQCLRRVPGIHPGNPQIQRLRTPPLDFPQFLPFLYFWYWGSCGSDVQDLVDPGRSPGKRQYALVSSGVHQNTSRVAKINYRGTSALLYVSFSYSNKLFYCSMLRSLFDRISAGVVALASVILSIPTVPQIYKAFFPPSLLCLTSSMACRVFRNVKLFSTEIFTEDTQLYGPPPEQK